MIKRKELSYLKYWDVNNLYGWAMLHKFPENGFKWVTGISKFDEVIMKSYNKKSKEEYFFEVDFQYSENLHNAQKDLLFLPKRMKIE